MNDNNIKEYTDLNSIKEELTKLEQKKGLSLEDSIVRNRIVNESLQNTLQNQWA